LIDLLASYKRQEVHAIIKTLRIFMKYRSCFALGSDRGGSASLPGGSALCRTVRIWGKIKIIFILPLLPLPVISLSY
jgi:hypothetical protein